VKPGCVLAIYGEDDTDEVNRRFTASAIVFKLQDSSQTLADRIRAFPLVGADARLTQRVAGTLVGTSFADEIISAAARLSHCQGEPVRLIVLDHVGLLHGGDFNAREDASLTMRIVNRIASETGAAILLLAHSPKSAQASEESDAMAVAGSTAFVDQARGAFVLAQMRSAEAKKFEIPEESRREYVSLTTVKNNYGPSGTQEWFQRRTVQDYAVGVLVPVQLARPSKGASSADSALNARIIALTGKHRGQFSRTKLRDTYSGKDGPLKACKRDVERALDGLRASGVLVERAPTENERKQFSLGRQVAHVLDIGE